ncbi:Phenol 2-monooxygenase [Cytospora mali]|uniref:Phenol 2-monooxygenase n=1 Tax=Cytospora mali TaxID=578113 RepID=A0A194VXN8_CYTMA|nr:Phenol 2-monooxygenase [Valsa mali]
MAKSIQPSTWERGFKELASGTPWAPEGDEEEGDDDNERYICAPSREVITSAVHNNFGINVMRTWPTLHDGTNNPHGLPAWWNPSNEIRIDIRWDIAAGPSGLQVALSLARQNVSFRIIDKADGPLVVGRADGVQPRFLETVAMWGLADEISEEGPLIERTAIYKDGKKLLFGRSHQSDSRYRGLHIITQGQIERIYIRDLARHRSLVERNCILEHYTVDNDTTAPSSHPVQATIRNQATGKADVVRAKFLVGSDGASSMIRKRLGVSFDGVSTDIYWGIMDCIYESDYPHAWVFGTVISSQHGGCVIIPREDGYIRLYTQLDVSATGPIAASRQASDASFAESGGQVNVHSITPDEVLEQANNIFAPYKLKFAAPLSWFAIWKISERVASSFSSEDMRIHLVGDAAHVHSVMGAFGLNASILDSANLAWKIGLVARNRAKLDTLLSTYSTERRSHAARIIETSGRYLRFVCGSDLAVVSNLGAPASSEDEEGFKAGNGESNGEGAPKSVPGSGTKEEDMQFLGNFFKENGQFLVGTDCAYGTSAVVSPQPEPAKLHPRPPIKVRNGVRAPNPRVCFSDDKTGYLYDKLGGPPRFHIVLFVSTLQGREVLRQATCFARGFLPHCYERFGGLQCFNLIAVVKCMPFELEARQRRGPASPDLDPLWRAATVVFDDRAPDEDAHTTWGVNHATGGVAVIRPDLWVGMTASPAETDGITEYFESFLLADNVSRTSS